MEAVIQLTIWVRHPFTISRVMLPGTVSIRQTLAADFIEVINVDIDVVITVTVVAAMVIPVIIMMMIPIVIVPVDAAEDGIGGCYAQAET
jgi:hypothetical protein